MTFLATPKDSKAWIGVTFVFALFLTFEAFHASSHEVLVLMPSDADFIDTGNSQGSKDMLRASRLRMNPTVMGFNAGGGSTHKPRQLFLLGSDESSAASRSLSDSDDSSSDSDSSSASKPSSEAREVDDSSSKASLRASRSRTSPTATDSSEEGEHIPNQQPDSLSDSGSSSGSGPSETHILDSAPWSEAMLQASRSRMDPTGKVQKRNKGRKGKKKQQQVPLLHHADQRKSAASREHGGKAHKHVNASKLWNQGLDSISAIKP